MKNSPIIAIRILAPCAIFLIAYSSFAQDKIIKTDGTSQEAKILAVSGNNVQIQVGGGMIGIPLVTVSQVVMAPPAGLAAATAAYEAKDYAKALTSIKAVTDKYRGLPVDWAKQASAMLGDVYVALNDLPKAETAYQDYLKAYPGRTSLQSDVGLARIAFAKKDYAAARQKLDPIKEQAMSLKSVSPELASAYSKTFYLLGQVEEAQGDFSNSLQDYLRTVTWFYADNIAVAAAQERADALRKEHNISIP